MHRRIDDPPSQQAVPGSDGDDSTISADVSGGLGLIVTEPVINALKHALPNDSSGKIKVDYDSRGPNWTLSVSDAGIGMPEDVQAFGASFRPRSKCPKHTPDHGLYRP
jgi:two-component sensor histidine kinase